MATRLIRALALAAALLPWGMGAGAEPLTVAAFNVESPNTPHSDPTDPHVVAAEISARPDVQLWGFEEVLDASWIDIFLAEANKSGRAFDKVVGTTGGGDRLLVLYDTTKLEKLGQFELISLIQDNCGKKPISQFRAPLIVEFKLKQSGNIFWYGANHLQRGTVKPNPYRTCQAKQLNAWTTSGNAKSAKVLIGGDFNLDYDVVGGDGGNRDEAYDALIADKRWRWLRPATLLKTECDPQFNSVLDFFFVNAKAASWKADATILDPDPSYCTRDPKHMSDHRPILVKLEVK